MRNSLRTFATPPRGVDVRKQGENTVIGGLAAPFHIEIKYQGQREQILPSAFDEVLANDDDVRLFTDHEYKVENLLATRQGGNLRLQKTEKGLEYEASLPSPTDKVRHIINLAQRGELGASIGWQSSKEKYIDGVRNFTDIKLSEISLTPLPAYPTTTVEQRSKDYDVWIALFQAKQQAINRRWQC